MKFIKLFFWGVFYINFCNLSAQDKYIKVVDVDSQAIAHVTVIFSAGKVAQTNNQGLVKIPFPIQSDFNLQLRHISYHQLNVTIQPPQFLTDTFVVVFTENYQILSPVSLITNKAKYIEKIPSISLKINVPINELPQKINIATRSLLENYGITSTAQFTKLTSGITLSYGDFNAISYLVRGTNDNNNRFRNGVGGYSWNQIEDIDMIERVEFIKGPAGFIIGNSEAGGFINIITKQPTEYKVNDINVGLGSFNMFRGSVDFGGKLSPKSKLLYRFSAGGQYQNSFTEFTKEYRFFIAPSIQYRIDSQSFIQFEYNRTQGYINLMDNYYNIGFKNQIFSLPTNFSSLDLNLEPGIGGDNFFRLFLVKSLKKGWRLQGHLAYIFGQYYAQNMFVAALSTNMDTIYRNFFNIRYENNLKNFQLFVDKKIILNKNWHDRFLIGIDAAHVQVNYNSAFYASGNDVSQLIPLSIKFPDYNAAKSILKNFIPDYHLNLSIYEWISLYVQNHVKYKEHWVFTLAGRFNTVRSQNGFFSSNFSAVFTPRLGITFVANDNHSIFLMQDGSYLPQLGLIKDSSMPKPLISRNIEFGYKGLFFNKNISIKASIYQITRTNILVKQPNSPYSSEQGSSEISGAELDIVGTLSKQWVINVNYTFLESKITENLNPLLVGKRDAYIPLHNFNALVRYQFKNNFLKNVAIGIIGSGVFDRSGIDLSTNVVTNYGIKVPDYVTTDFNLTYHHYRFMVNFYLYNIFNQQYVNFGYFNSATNQSSPFWRYAPGTPINTRIELKIRL